MSSTLTLRPNANGTTQLTPNSGANYTRVNEVTADGNTSYVYNLFTYPSYIYGYLYDTYQFQDHTSETNTILKVEIFARCWSLYGAAAVKLVINTHGTLYYSGAITIGGGAYSNQSYYWTVNPNTGVAWTWAEIDALLAGISLNRAQNAYYDGKYYYDDYSYCTQVYAVVTYASPPTVTTQAVTSITGTAAVGNGNITVIEGVNQTKRGFYFSTSNPPTASDEYIEETGSFGTGAFTENL